MHYLVIGHCEFTEPDYIFYQGNNNAKEIEKMATKDLTEEYITEYDEDDLDEDESPIVYIDHIFESKSEIHFTKGFFQ